MKNRSNIIYQHLIITFLLFFAQKTVSQSNQWTSTVKVGGTPQLADWVFDVITTEEKNYFAVGFAKENEANPATRPDVPAYCLLSPNGRLIGDGVIELSLPQNPDKVAQGRLYNVVETPDAYFAVGCSECFGSSSKGILVKVDKSTLSYQNWLLLPSKATSARLNDISYVDNNGDRFVLVSGWALDGSRKKWVAAYNLDGTLRNTNGAPHELVSAESGEVGAMTHEVTADGKVRIYTAASLLRSISSDSNLPMRRVDTDVQINTITYDAGNATLFTEAAPLAVSSITSRAYGSPGTVRDRNIAIRGLIHTGQDAEGLDLDARYEDVLSLLQTRNQTEDRILRTGTLAALGRYAEAQAVNNTLVGADPEISSYRAYMDNILAAGTGVDALPEQHYLTALTSLNAENVSARLMAQNLQQLREDIYLPLVALNPEVGAQYRAMPIGQTVVQAAPKAVLAAPNPFHSQIAFDLSGMEAARLVITDLMGRSVLVRSVQGMERYVWYANGLADGAYNYQVWSQDRLLQSGKLLKTKGQ
jgi:hypothetical protein